MNRGMVVPFSFTRMVAPLLLQDGGSRRMVVPLLLSPNGGSLLLQSGIASTRAGSLQRLSRGLSPPPGHGKAVPPDRGDDAGLGAEGQVQPRRWCTLRHRVLLPLFCFAPLLFLPLQDAFTNRDLPKSFVPWQ